MSSSPEPEPSTSASSSGKETPKKPTFLALTKHTIPELKKMCADAKLPKTGTKGQLVASLVWGWKPNHQSLGKLNVAEMRKMCTDVNLPKTGTREQLRARLIEIPIPKNPKKKGGNVLTVDRVNKLFKDVGRDPKHINSCLKAGLLKGFIPLTDEGSLDLDQVVLKSVCTHGCGKELTCTIRDAMEQPNYAGLEYEEGGESAAIRCLEEDGYGCGGNFIKGLCNGRPEFDCGKFYNHCGRCSNFGHCMGDYREVCNGRGRVRWVGLNAVFANKWL